MHKTLVKLICFHLDSATNIRRQRSLCDGLQVLLLLLPDLASYRSNNDFEERIRNETKNKFNATVYENSGVFVSLRKLKVRYFLRIGVERIKNLSVLYFQYIVFLLTQVVYINKPMVKLFNL